MSVSRRTLQALIAMGVSAGPSAVLAAPSPRDYAGPPHASPDLPPGSTPSPPAETPPATPPVETPPPATPPPATPPPAETPPAEEDGGFVVEDLTEDPDALKKELEVKTPTVKGPSGTVTGKVKDATTGAPMIGAYVEAIGTQYKTKTDLDGNFTLPLPPGTYELRIRYDTSESKRFSNVVVKEGESQTVSTELAPLAGGAQVVAVKAEMNRESEGARLLQRKESVASRDILSRESIAKSGGGSTASVAVRIVGATVIDGKYLFVRGLGHRYGNTLFDGARVPSPDPDIRTVPLDIFPSGALSAINVQKTFTPDVPGDFAGASVQLETREIPKKLTFDVNAQMGINTQTTFQPIYHEGGFPGADGFALGNLPRALSKDLPTDFPASRSVLGDDGRIKWTPQEIEKFGEALYTDTRVRKGRIGPPNFRSNAALGYGFSPHDGGKLGFLAAVSYRNQHQNYKEKWRFYGTEDPEGDGTYTLTKDDDLEGMRTVQNVQWSTVGLVKYEPAKGQKLSLSAFYSRDADDEVRQLDGTLDSDVNARTTRIRYSMRSILMTRLGGVHEIEKAKNLKIDWFGSYGQARRDDPAVRDMVYKRPNVDGTGPLRVENQGATNLDLDLVDHTGSGALNFTMPFKQWRQLEGKVKLGTWLEGKKREFLVRRFTFQNPNGLTSPVGTDNILNNSTIGDGTPASQGGTEPFFIQETTQPFDSYHADQQIYAGYGLLDLPFARWFRIAGGARFEANRQRVQPFNLFTGETDAERSTTIRNNNVLPSVSLIFPATQKMNVRLSGTQTVARPEFRELAPFLFSDFVGGIQVEGQPGLKTATIWNADLRWEWFPSAEEVVAVSAFFKYFEDPIERTVTTGGGAPQSTFRNAKLAYNIGAEFEMRKNLEFISKALKDLSVGLNFAYVYSRVQLADTCEAGTPGCTEEEFLDHATSRVRPLQGQAPFVANAYIDYENKKIGTGVRLLYNAVLQNVAFVGAGNLPDIYMQPIHQLDFVGSQRIYKGLRFTLMVQNMLNWPIRWRHGKSKDGALVYEMRPGATIWFGLAYDL
jgi:hypothetical protein